MRCFMIFAIAAFAALATDVALAADVKVKLESRAPSSRITATLSVTSQLVVIPVTVLDREGAPMPGLSRTSFRVWEDGVEQRISSFRQDDAPVSIGIVFDASRSMEPRMAQSRAAVRELFADALPEDEFHLVEFNDRPRLLCGLTTDTRQVGDALERVTARGWTALFDGMYLSAQHLRRAHHPRKALVVISDGDDNFSRYRESELRSYLMEAGVVVYSIALSAAWQLPPHHLDRLSRETGGQAHSVGKMDTLAETVRAIGHAIRNQYVLTYSPTNEQQDGKFRRITLDYAPKSAGTSASWRQGYFAPDAR